MHKLTLICFLSARLLTMSSQTTNYTSFGTRFSLNADVNRLFVDPSTNILYAGGRFEYADGKKCRGVAQWNGTQWDTLSSGFDNAYNATGFSGNVYQILKYKTKLYFFGDFVQAGKKFTKSIGIWNGASWDSIGYYPNGIVYDADVYNDTLYICGTFTQIGSMTANYAAKFDGANWYPMNFSEGTIGHIRGFKNKIYATGAWYTNGYSLTAEYNNTTQSWQPSFGVQGNTFKSVNGLERIDSLLFFYGSFTHISVMYSPCIAAWSGTKLYGFGMGSDPDHNYGSIKNIRQLNNKTYSLGVFDNAGGMYPSIPLNQAVNIAELSFDTSFNRKWCISSEYFNNNTSDAIIYNDDLLISGDFTKINNDSIFKVAKWGGGAFTYSCNTFFTGINEINIYDNIKIFPNPAASTLNISDEQNELQHASIEITNSIGQTVISVPFNNSLDVSSFSQGCYFLNITTERKKVIHSKFIKN